MMNQKITTILISYLISIVIGNLIVYHLGRWGVLITSFIFIPFDFVIRCYIHEVFRGRRLYTVLFSVISLGAICTYVINSGAGSIALGSVAGFIFAGIVGSIVYQILIYKRAFYKVNGSDFAALITDSILFQLVAFNSVVWAVTSGQIVVKILGGLLWYYVLFVRFRLLKKIKSTTGDE